MESSIIRFNQQYRGITDILKHLSYSNQIVMDIYNINNAVSLLKTEYDNFLHGYMSKDIELPILYAIQDEVTVELKFTPIANDTTNSMTYLIDQMEDIIKYCGERL